MTISPQNKVMINVVTSSSVYFLQFSWFFLEIMAKSMAQHLVDSEKVKVNWKDMNSSYTYLSLLIQKIKNYVKDLIWYMVDV